MNVSSVLEAVTVYRAGALCTRRARVEPPPEGLAASQEIRITGLPLSMEPGSLRARVAAGPEGLRVLDVQPAFDAELAPEAEVPVERKALEEASARAAQLRTALARVQAEIGELSSLAPKFTEPKRGEAPREAHVASILALADFTEARLAERLERRRTLERELDDADEEVRLRERRLQETSTSKRTERARLTRAAIVRLAGGRGATQAVELAVEYQVPGARWTPSYELRLDRGLGGGALKMRASIAQRTGEDWIGVRLALSTASIARRADVPELRSLRIGRAQPEPPRAGWREPPPGLDALFDGYDTAMRGAPQLATDFGSDEETSSAATARLLERVAAVQARTNAASMPPPPAPKPQPVSRGRAVAASAPPPAPPPYMPGPIGAPLPPPAPRAAPAMNMPAPGGGFGGAAAAAPPMMPMSMARPAPAMEMMEEARAGAPMMKRRSRGSILGGVADAFRRDEGGGGGEDDELGAAFDEPALAPPEPEIAAPDSLLDYDHLEMVAMSASSARGRLVPVKNWDVRFALGVRVDVHAVMEVVHTSRHAALELSWLTLPPDHRDPESLDSFDYRYDCAAPADVPSTGRWSTVAVTTCEVGLQPELLCVPAVDPKAYRTLIINNNRSARALLAGPVDVSAGDEFLLTAQLPSMAPGVIGQRLGLGVEESVKVARRTQFKETTGGLLGGSAVLQHEIEVEISNRLPSAALVEVRERVPVPEPGEKDLKVEEADVRPAWEKLDGPIDGTVVVPGARRWRVTVPAGGRTTLTARFNVRMPGDRMLVGGNRRV